MEENTSKVYVGRDAGLLAERSLATTGSAPAVGGSPGTQLFVINLCASIAPVQLAGKTIPGFENYKLYQVARAEDGRTRHRLRLGFFTSEADADRVLAAVRDNYPTAFTTCLSDDDRRFARGYLPDTETTASWKRPVALVEKTAPPAAVKAPPKPAVAAPAAQPAKAPVAPAPAASRPVAAKTPTPAAAPKVVPPAADASDIDLSWEPPALQAAAPAVKNTQTVTAVFRTEQVIKSKPAEAAPARTLARTPEVKQAPAPAKPQAAIELSLAKEAAPAIKPAAAPATPDQPFHVGKGVEIPAVSLSLEATAIQQIAKPAPAPAAPPAAKTAPAPSKAAAKPAASMPPKAPIKHAPAATPPAKAATHAPVASSAPTRAAPPPRISETERHAPELDSTQTIRALTSTELNDDSQEKWFSIQLVVSEQPVNLDAMPHLDIFEAYRLYSVANAGSGKILHSLRIGFFREQVSAEAVCGYLKTFFPSPSALRISTAEHLRFKDAPPPKAIAAGSSRNEGKVIELNHARDRKPTVPTVTEVASPAHDRSPTGMFKTSTSGSYKVNATGTHKALKPAAKPSPATRRSAPVSKAAATGRHKALQKKSLQEQLLDEAREVDMSESAIRKLPKNDSLLSRLVGKLTK